MATRSLYGLFDAPLTDPGIKLTRERRKGARASQAQCRGGARKGCAQRLGAAERLRARAPQGVCADCPANLAIPSPITRLGTIIYNNFGLVVFSRGFFRKSGTDAVNPD